jgi:sec-independent protein translocase protein TatC
MFYKYFFELRNRFFLLVYGWIFTATISYFYKETLLFLLIKPISSIPIYFIFTNITEILSTYLKLVYFLSNQIFLICFAYHILMFLAPGLYYCEYQLLTKVVLLSFFFFFFSVFMLNTMILPACWHFFLSFQKTITTSSTINLYFEAKINEYINFYVNLYYMCNLNCQMFMTIILFLIFIKNDLRLIKKFRKIFYLTFVVFATIITPPDIPTQLIFSASIIIIYEILIFSTLLKNYLIWKPIKAYQNSDCKN